MSRLDQRSPEILRQIGAALDDQLTSEELARLETQLLVDPQAMKVYWDMSQLAMDLHTRERTRRATRAGLAGIEAAVSDQKTSNRRPPSVRGKRPRAVATENRKRKTEDGKKLSAFSSQPSATSDAQPTPRSKSWLNRASRHPLVPSIGIAVIIFVALFVGMALTPMGQWIAGGDGDNKNGLKPTPETEHVAILNHWHNAVWLDGTRPPLNDPRLKVGRRLVLGSGLIEIKYHTGARVVIEGPAEFTVGGQESGVRDQESGNSSRRRKPMVRDKYANSGYLKLGKLVARVEGEDAQGFTIETPNARVEDFGTEFGVDVQERGAAEFVVLSGKVDVVREASGDQPAQRVRLTKDEGAFIATGSGRITKRKKVDLRFMVAMRGRLKTIRQVPSASAATITWNGTTVTHMANDGVAANNFAQLIGGTYVEGGHVFADDGDLGGTYVVNDTVGSRLLSFTQLATAGGPFGANAVNTGDANFDNILSGGNNFGPYTVTLGGTNPLTIGTTYTVQIWGHAADPGAGFAVTFKGDEAVGTAFTGQISGGTTPNTTGNPITDNPWFVTGTFTANASTQIVTITGSRSVGFDAYLVTTTTQPQGEKNHRKANPKYEDRNPKQGNNSAPSEEAALVD